MRHLGLWLRDGDRGVAAVAYREPDTAAAARRRLRPGGRKVRTHRLVRHERARTTVFELIDAVESVGDGILHVVGWEDAFGGSDLPERLYGLNFLRESVVEHPATQVWWMPVAFRDAFMLRAPDTWSVVKLKSFLADEEEYATLSPRVAERVRSLLGLPLNTPIPRRLLVQVNRLNAPFSNLDDSDLPSLASLTRLELLGLTGTRVLNVLPIARLSTLKVLYLRHTKVSRVSPLSRLKNLRLLNLQKTLVTPHEIDKLRAALPDCDIIA